MNGEGGGTSAESASKSSDEDDDDLSSSQDNSQIENVLDSFRQQWKEELSYSRRQQKKVDVTVGTDVKNVLEEEDVEQKAEVLFLRGSELERKGKFYEAIQFYRRAVQLVPDIEFKFCAKQKSKDYQESKNTSNESLDNYHDNSSEENEDFDGMDDFVKGNLLSHIQRRFSKQCYICKPKREQQNQTHISALPMEIILYLLRWVVSTDLDMRSLEMFSRTCRGYYLCCRDSEIWRLACVKIWGVNLTSLPSGFNSWRQLYIERARLRFNGCYISKTTYIRHGENSFQDEFYRPWHIVTYYRYLRFFPEGQVLMLTTPDEPSQSVGQLKFRTPRSASVLSGHYILKEDKVALVVHRLESSVKGNSGYKRNKKRDTIHDSQQTFHLEMQIQNYKNQKSTQLVWTSYSVYTRNRNGTESTYTFEIVNNRFPPLWFSRVKSYTAESFSPL